MSRLAVVVATTVAALARSACQPAASAAGTHRTPQAPPAWPASLVLAIGERAPVGAGTLKLQRIAADSRCPAEAQCIWAGEVTLAFVHAPAHGASRSFQLSERTAPRTDLGGHAIELTGFGPCPAGHAPASAEGCATLAFSSAELR